MAKDTLNRTALRAMAALLRPDLFAPASSSEAEEIGALLCDVVSTAAAAFPDVDVPADGFVRHLIEKLPAGKPPVEAILGLRGPDLYLAYACSRGEPAALAVFEATFASELKIVLSRARSGGLDPLDVRQVCLEKLFAAERPKIAEYSGQGDLRGWLRVTLLRTLIDMARKRGSRAEASEEQILEVPAPGNDPELEYLKRLYRGEFKRAFEEAALALSAEDRNVLRYHYAHGLTIDQIGALYSVHRATAARRVAKARAELLAETRRRLGTRLKLSSDELDSVMRMIESDVHMSLTRVLGAGEAAAG